MANIAFTLSDSPDGLVQIQCFLDGIVEGQPFTPAQSLAKAMLDTAAAAAAEDPQIVELNPITH